MPVRRAAERQDAGGATVCETKSKQAMKRGVYLGRRLSGTAIMRRMGKHIVPRERSRARKPSEAAGIGPDKYGADTPSTFGAALSLLLADIRTGLRMWPGQT